MKWASAASDEPTLERAVAAVSATVKKQLGGAAPDLLVAFVSAHHATEYERLRDLLAPTIGGGLLIGCSAGGVIGGGHEIEQRPGFSLTAAHMPDVQLTPFHLQADDVPAEDAGVGEWERRLGVAVATEPHFLLLPDPFSFDAESFISSLDRIYPLSQKIGGLASGGREPGANALYLGPAVHRSGLVGIALSGDIAVDAIVAQGCRPIGEPMFVTRCQKNVIWELDGESPLKVLQDLYKRLEPGDQELAGHSLFLGIVMKEDRHEYHQGDFLIRNLIGSDAKSGALAVGTLLKDGAVVQFHLRDKHTSTQDLKDLLRRHAASESPAPAGSLLFSCLGRGIHLYGRPDQDTGAFRDHLGDVPLGGFFCNGEIGPVHGTTFLHGYTSSFGLFRRRFPQS